jgi:hypothetical protein
LLCDRLDRRDDRSFRPPIPTSHSDAKKTDAKKTAAQMRVPGRRVEFDNPTRSAEFRASFHSVRAAASEVESARTVDEAIQRLETRIENDFAEGQHQSLEGWILASTELRLCALVHVSIRPPDRGSASG